MIIKMNKTSPISRNRLARRAHPGSLASSVAGGLLAESLRQVVRGNTPRASDLVLTLLMARRVADKLSALRGAAMKVRQWLSMDACNLLPPGLTSMLSREVTRVTA